jgi:hypothetical protein
LLPDDGEESEFQRRRSRGVAPPTLVAVDAWFSSESVACRASSRTSALTTDEQLNGRSTAHRECGDDREGADSTVLLLFVNRAARGAVGRAGPARGAWLAAA